MGNEIEKFFNETRSDFCRQYNVPDPLEQVSNLEPDEPYVTAQSESCLEEVQKILKKLEKIADTQIQNISESDPASPESLKELAITYFWSGYYMAKRESK